MVGGDWLWPYSAVLCGPGKATGIRLTLSVCPGLNLQSRLSDSVEKLMPLEEGCITVPKRRGRRATWRSTGLGQDAGEGARGMHRHGPSGVFCRTGQPRKGPVEQSQQAVGTGLALVVWDLALGDGEQGKR